MLKVAYLTDGRDWAYGIAKAVAKNSSPHWKIETIFVKKNPPFPIDQLGISTTTLEPQEVMPLYREGAFKDYDVILVYGWSWILPQEIVGNTICICNHPSPLPKYRGGTPLQNQIIRGEKTSMISLFRMQKGIDDGPIYLQKEFSLAGHLSEILKRMEETGKALTLELLDGLADGTFHPEPQDETQATLYSRRKPEDSELKPEQLAQATQEWLWNFIRMLEDPYPNAFVLLKDGKKILLKQVEKVSKSKSEPNILFKELSHHTSLEIQSKFKEKSFYLECSDGGKLCVKSFKIE